MYLRETGCKYVNEVKLAEKTLLCMAFVKKLNLRVQ